MTAKSNIAENKERAAKTRLTVETHMVGKVSYAAQMLAGMEAGWNQSLDRLADFVAKG